MAQYYRVLTGLDTVDPESGAPVRHEPGSLTDRIATAALEWLVALGAIAPADAPAEAPPAPAPDPAPAESAPAPDPAPAADAPAAG